MRILVNQALTSVVYPNVVGLSLSAALAATGCSLSVSITELSKAMVCGVLSMGHCT